MNMSEEGGKIRRMKTYSHSTVKRSRDLIIGFKTRAATQDLRKPELTNSSSHMLNLALRRRSCFDPLRRLSSDTAYEICVGQSLGRWSLSRGHSAGQGLRDPRVQGGCSARYSIVCGIAMLARRWSSCLTRGRSSTSRGDRVPDRVGHVVVVGGATRRNSGGSQDCGSRAHARARCQAKVLLQSQTRAEGRLSAKRTCVEESEDARQD